MKKRVWMTMVLALPAAGAFAYFVLGGRAWPLAAPRPAEARPGAPFQVTSDAYQGYTEDPGFSSRSDCAHILDLRGSRLSRKPVQVRLFDRDFVFEVAACVEGDADFTRRLCTDDGKFCDDVHDYAELRINGKSIVIAREEIRRVAFSDGLTLDIANLDNDPELCLAEVRGRE